MKTQLTAEQSAKLIELGVSPERASEIKVEVNEPSRGCPNIYCSEVKYPIFTLSDIIYVLPKEIRHNGCTYKLNEDDDLDSLKGYLCEELIDTLYLLLVWCLKKGYVK